MFCPNCGSKVADGAAFCGSCGAMIAENNDSSNNANPQPNSAPFVPNTNPTGKAYSISSGTMATAKSPLFLALVALMAVNCVMLLTKLSDLFDYAEAQAYMVEWTFDLPAGLFQFIYTVAALVPFVLTAGLVFFAVVGYTGKGNLLSPSFKTMRIAFIVAAVLEILTYLVVLLMYFVDGQVEYMFDGNFTEVIYNLSNFILPIFIIMTYTNIAACCKSEGKISMRSSMAKAIAYTYFARAFVNFLLMVDVEFTFELFLSFAIMAVAGVFFIDYEKKNR